jgi:hypothetical protein
MLTDIKEQAHDLCETDLELNIEDTASKYHTIHKAALKAILECEQEAKMYPILWTHIGGKVSSTLDTVWTPENPADLKNTTWKAHVNAEAIWEALLSHR